MHLFSDCVVCFPDVVPIASIIIDIIALKTNSEEFGHFYPFPKGVDFDRFLSHYLVTHRICPRLWSFQFVLHTVGKTQQSDSMAALVCMRPSFIALSMSMLTSLRHKSNTTSRFAIFMWKWATLIPEPEQAKVL